LLSSYADLSGNGFNDGMSWINLCASNEVMPPVLKVILSDEYGPSMNDIWPQGGRVSWYENVGDLNSTEQWKRRYIGKSPGMHRLKGALGA
jgi:aldos-2-ulose dehydratase